MASVAREMQAIKILSKNSSYKHPFFSEMLIKQQNTVENSHQAARGSCGEMPAAVRPLRTSQDQADQTTHCAWPGTYRGRSSSFDQTSYS